MKTLSGMEWRVRISASLVFLGLGVELLALRWVHPASFLVFAMAGIPLVAAGIVVFLFSLVSRAE